ncbi:sulfotransferase [Chloroflexi bacterium TSY]|nr:sulfotransferase [Chloroflexi bacterium TSY]
MKQPIFINGVGRSGSTLFHRLFSAHPHVAWLSRLSEQFPKQPVVNRYLMNGLDIPAIGKILQKKVKPRECYSFWNHYYPGFGVSCRDLTAHDVTNRVKKRLPQALAQTLTPKRNRLLIKITGWPRVGFLHELFDDIKFISIVRDGRAVVNSMINVGWWWGWQGPENWRWGQLTEHQQALWERHNRSFVALAAIEWTILMEADRLAREQFPAKKQ